MESHAYKTKKLKLATMFALTTAILLFGGGCAKDENPPFIQQVDIPEWAIEDASIDLTVRAADDRGMEEVYVKFDSGDNMSLTKVDSHKNGEEVSSWTASFKLSPKDYSYSIVAEDKAGNQSDPEENKITVYSKNSLYGYATGRGLDNYLSQLSSLGNNGIVDANGKAFIDLVAKYPKAGELISGIYAELLKLPDLMKVDEKDIEGVEDILILADNPKYKDVFESMLNTGIHDKRKYCSPLEALLWIAYDGEFESPTDNPLEQYSLEKLMNDAWENTNTSRNYKSDRWKDFDEVVARLNFPEGAYYFTEAYFTYEMEPFDRWSTPNEFFYKRRGDCTNYSQFIVHCLLEGGYYLDKFDKTPEAAYPPNAEVEIHETNAACLVSCLIYDTGGNLQYQVLHDVPAVKIDGKIYCLDPLHFWAVRGPFESIRDMVETNITDKIFSKEQIYLCMIIGDLPWRAIGIVPSESYWDRRINDESFRKAVRAAADQSVYYNEENIGYNKWIPEYFDNLKK